MESQQAGFTELQANRADPDNYYEYWEVEHGFEEGNDVGNDEEDACDEGSDEDEARQSASSLAKHIAYWQSKASPCGKNTGFTRLSVVKATAAGQSGLRFRVSSV